MSQLAHLSDTADDDDEVEVDDGDDLVLVARTRCRERTSLVRGILREPPRRSCGLPNSLSEISKTKRGFYDFFFYHCLPLLVLFMIVPASESGRRLIVTLVAKKEAKIIAR